MLSMKNMEARGAGGGTGAIGNMIWWFRFSRRGLWKPGEGASESGIDEGRWDEGCGADKCDRDEGGADMVVEETTATLGFMERERKTLLLLLYHVRKPKPLIAWYYWCQEYNIYNLYLGMVNG